ncbi:MAG: hypothetical protein FJX76_13660 [Armatimonadetes bacterium]|nr:hypothetical protein [Armatimonadota bacterium]
MSFFKNWARKVLDSLSGDSRAPEDDEGDEEALDWSARLVYAPVRGAARVWKTQATGATPEAIFLLPPNTEWESSLPAEEPVTVVFTRPGEMAEFECVVRRIPGPRGLRLSVDRPETLGWRKADTPVNQNRKFLRVEISLPAEVSMIEPSVSGRGKQSARRTAAGWWT